ncbi:hypothetical protein AWB76_07009 [Caballeronia temeraria]|uniref:Uncharacterized protein n=1 Tax=Caballeronia temeraria TaxID=1777137 RepID=A0A158DIH0_9BURK|nr:hypothetical protein AWB76_07009 [Caballeronia temeraria]
MSILKEVDAAHVADVCLQFGEQLRLSFTTLTRQSVERLALARHHMTQDALDRFDHVASDEFFAAVDCAVRVVLAERHGGQHHADAGNKRTCSPRDCERRHAPRWGRDWERETRTVRRLGA